VRASSHVVYLSSVVANTEPKQVYVGKKGFVSERTIKDIIITPFMLPLRCSPSVTQISCTKSCRTMYIDEGKQKLMLSTNVSQGRSLDAPAAAVAPAADPKGCFRGRFLYFSRTLRCSSGLKPRMGFLLSACTRCMPCFHFHRQSSMTGLATRLLGVTASKQHHAVHCQTKQLHFPLSIPLATARRLPGDKHRVSRDDEHRIGR